MKLLLGKSVEWEMWFLLATKGRFTDLLLGDEAITRMVSLF